MDFAPCIKCGTTPRPEDQKGFTIACPGCGCIQKLPVCKLFAPKGPVALPKNCSITENDSALVLTRGWWSASRHLLSLVLALTADAGIFIFAWAFGWTMRPDLYVYAAIYLLVALLINYYAVVMAINKTTIRVALQEISIVNGPLPWQGCITMPIREIRMLSWDEDNAHPRRSTITTYSICAFKQGGERHGLLKDINSVDEARFLEQEMTRFLGIKEAAV